MIKFAANLTMMFQEWSFLDRFEAARDAGFRAVEFSFPTDVSIERITRQLDCTGLRQALATVRLQPGSKGLAAIAGQHQRFREDFRAGLEYAAAAGSPLLHVLTGTVERSDVAASCGQFLSNMEWAITQAESMKICLVVEAINQHSIPNYFIRSLEDALTWSSRLPGLGVILDIYHASVEGLDAYGCVRDYASRCEHIQIAGYPGRHEPDKGLLNLPELLTGIRASGYCGWIGCEYQPEASTLEGLTWLTPQVG